MSLLWKQYIYCSPQWWHKYNSDTGSLPYRLQLVQEFIVFINNLNKPVDWSLPVFAVLSSLYGHEDRGKDDRALQN